MGGKFLGFIGATASAYDAVQNARKGNNFEADMDCMAFCGAMLGTFGTSSWAGPVGLAVGLAAAGGKMFYETQMKPYAIHPLGTSPLEQEVYFPN